MKEKKDLFFALILALGFVLSAYLISDSIVKAKKFDRSVVVKGLAEKEVMANLAIWPIKISETSNNLSEIEKNFKRKYRVIHSFLKGKGFNDKEITKGLPAIFDSRTDRYASQNQKSNYRYIGSLEITVRTRDLGKLKAAISDIPGLIGKGIVIEQSNYWRKVEYLYTSLNDIKPEMIEKATKNARKAAEKFAVDSGSKVGKIKTASQGLFTITDRDINSPHIKKIRVVSTVEFYLRD